MDDEERTAGFGNTHVLRLSTWKDPRAKEQLVCAARYETDAAEAVGRVNRCRKMNERLKTH